MANRSTHFSRVEAVASEFNAAVRFSGDGHLRVTGASGWYVTLPSTPRKDWSETRIRNAIEKGIYRLSLKKAERIGKKANG